MKKFMMAAMALLIATGVFSANNFAKDAKKQAKQMAKQGWIVSPGALPLERQLEESYEMQAQRDENGDSKYIWGDALSIGENYDGAKMQAHSLAINNLAGRIQTDVTAKIKNEVKNKQLPAEDAATVTKTLMEGEQFIAQSIGRTITVVECYRILPNKNREVMVRIAYNADKAKEVVKKVVREELEKQGVELHNQLDELLGF